MLIPDTNYVIPLGQTLQIQLSAPGIQLLLQNQFSIHIENSAVQGAIFHAGNLDIICRRIGKNVKYNRSSSLFGAART